MGREGVKGKKGLRDAQGFTLIEIILSIAILAILTLPVMNYFSDSVRHNARSRIKQNATVAAQDILESFKNSSYSLDDIAVVQSAEPDWTVASAQASVGEKYTLKKDLTVDKSTFQVEAEIEPRSSDAPISYKEYVIGSMDTTTDVLSSESGNALTKAELSFFNRYQSHAGGTLEADANSYEKFENLLNCEIIVSSEVDPNNAKNKIVRTTYSYTYDHSLGSLAGIDSYEYTQEVSANSIPGDQLKNIYIFYTPLNNNDKLTFQFQQNKSGADEVSTDFGPGSVVKDISLFIVAQDSLDDMGNSVSHIPAGYQLSVTAAGGAESFGDAITKVYTNLTSSGIDTSSIVVSGKLEGSLVHTEDMNRLADIQVRVLKDGDEYVKVSGSKVQK